jgi:antitoxin (DNA-binding transcriptional repressor) of toxin-antitoxin stability system
VDPVSISVTEASRNFADCVNRARYQGTSFILLRGGAPVARIEPAEAQPPKGRELAAAFQKAVEGVHVGEEEATSWLHDLEQARGSLQPQVRPWRF